MSNNKGIGLVGHVNGFSFGVAGKERNEGQSGDIGPFLEGEG